MRINHNIAALNTYNKFSAAGAGQAKSMEKLSSGLRINKAGDDAAGLAISEKMRGQIRGLDMAAKNSQDATSMIQTAEGALNETHDILQRMRELAVQASNDTNTTDDRGEIQKEINQLTSEINRIGNTTEFNTKKLLNGDLSDTKSLGSIDITKAGTTTVNQAIGVTWSGDTAGRFAVTDGTNAGVDFSGTAKNGFTWSAVKNTAVNELSIQKDATTGTFKVDFTGEDNTGNKLTIDAEQMTLVGDTYKYDNHGIKFEISKSEFDKVADGTKVVIDIDNGAAAAVDATAKNYGVLNDWTSSGHATDTTKQATLDTNKITVAASDKRLEGVTSVRVTGSGDISAAGGAVKVELLDSEGSVLVEEDFTKNAGFRTGGFEYDAHGISFKVNFGAQMTNEGFSFKANLGTEEKSLGTTDASATFQIGANENQSMTLSFSDMRASALGITGTGAGFSSGANVTDGTNNTMAEKALDVTSAANAAKAITTIDAAIKSVSAERSKLGASQNRLEHTINNLGTASENLTAAESRVRDVDYASAA